MSGVILLCPCYASATSCVAHGYFLLFINALSFYKTDRASAQWTCEDMFYILDIACYFLDSLEFLSSVVLHVARRKPPCNLIYRSQCE